MPATLLTILLVIFVVIVSVCDLRYNKIFNELTLLFLIIGFVQNVWFFGLVGFLSAIMGMTTGLLILLLPFKWGWVGGGDVKFLAAAGAMVGPSVISIGTLWGLMLFGMIAVVYLIVKRRLKRFLYQLLFTVLTWEFIKGVSIIEVSGKLPLGIFLGIGVLFRWFYVLHCNA